MKPFHLLIFGLLLLCVQKSYAQQFKAKTEIQSTFIDITGLFGVDEPASVTQFAYLKKGFGLDLYHSFSVKNFGKTIQSIVTPSYTFKLDRLGKFSIKPKVEVANLETAGGGFVRPGIHFIYKLNAQNVLNVGTWSFIDVRNKTAYPRRLNGYTYLVSYTHYNEFKKWKLTEEGRILFVDIADNLKVSGIFTNLQLNYQPLNLFVGANAVYTFYRSDNKNELIWNITLGKQF
jgi:hypothetical protein